MISNEIRTNVLVGALPYILKYKGKVVVIKYGGNAMIDEDLKKSVMNDVTLLASVGIKVVLVHGGGPEISSMLNKIGKESKFVDGLRVTDKETVNIVTQVLAGKINKGLTLDLNNLGGKAVGLCGLDAGLILAKQNNPDLGYVGSVVDIHPQIISDLLASNYIPVVSTIGYDANGNIYNINADTAASRIAGALNAESFILMTDTVGVLENKDDPKTLIREVYVSDIKKLEKEGIIAGGMIPKIACCQDAIRRGVKQVAIIDGRVPHSILIEMLTDQGLGTMFK